MPTRTNRRHEMMSEGGSTQLRDPAAQAKSLFEDTLAYLREYAREKPESAALWCLGVGFVLGWKLKPW